MESECAVILSSVPVPESNMPQDDHSLADNWHLLPSDVKESHLVLDLVNLLSGLSSRFFTFYKNAGTGGYDLVASEFFTQAFGPEIVEMCSAILEIRHYQLVILDFLEESEKSFICQALSAEILDVLEDLQQCVSKFHGRHLESFLGLKKLVAYLKPANQTLQLLASAVTQFDRKDLLDDGTNIGVLIMDSLELRSRKELGPRRELLQHLLNVCLESYGYLITNYVKHLSVNDIVVDFFVKSDTDRSPLGESMKRRREDEASGPAKRGPETEPQSVCSCNEFNLWVDERYVPSVFREVAVKVFETGIFVKTLGTRPEFDLEFTSVSEMLKSIEESHRAASAELFERLKTESRLDKILGDFFNFYLLQRSDHLDKVVPVFERDLPLHQTNAGSVCADDRGKAQDISNCPNTNQVWVDRSAFGRGNEKLFFCFDNFKSLTLRNDNTRFVHSSFPVFRNFGDSAGTGFGLLCDRNYCMQRCGLRPGRLLQFMYPDLESGGDRSPDPLDGDPDYRNLLICYDLDPVSGLLFTLDLHHAYTLIFKLLFQLKYAEHCLNRLWVYHARTRQLPVEPDLVHKLNLQVFLLGRMQGFVRQVQRHFLVDVVGVEVARFQSVTHSDFHSLYRSHWRLAHSLSESLLLRDPALTATLQRMLLLAVKFATEVLAFFESPTFLLDGFGLLGCNSDNLGQFFTNGLACGNSLSALLTNPGYSSMVAIANAEFDRNLNEFRLALDKGNFSLAQKLDGNF